jgi:hypothetical protein
MKALPRYVEETAEGVTIAANGGLWKREPLSLKWDGAQHGALLLEKKAGKPRKVTGALVEGNTLYVSTESVQRPKLAFLDKSSEMLCFKSAGEARLAYDQLRSACPSIAP